MNFFCHPHSFLFYHALSLQFCFPTSFFFTRAVNRNVFQKEFIASHTCIYIVAIVGCAVIKTNKNNKKGEILLCDAHAHHMQMLFSTDCSIKKKEIFLRIKNIFLKIYE